MLKKFKFTMDFGLLVEHIIFSSYGGSWVVTRTSFTKLHNHTSDVGDIICWTRMQSEAGQGLKEIIARKEVERVSGDGLFFWGVGNPPSKALAELVRINYCLPVYFSIMKSKPKSQDSAPKRVLAWRQYVDVFGIVKNIPRHVLVTSRANSRKYHYALVCMSSNSLVIGDNGYFNPSDWRNTSASNGFVGASQVTALLRRVDSSNRGDYQIALEATLVGDYWVKLINPVEVSLEDRESLESIPVDSNAWVSHVTKIKKLRDDDISVDQTLRDDQYTLFTDGVDE